MVHRRAMIVRLGMHGATKVRIERPQRTKLVVTQHTFVLVSVPCTFGSPRTGNLRLCLVSDESNDEVVGMGMDCGLVDSAMIGASQAGTGLEV